MSQTAGNVLLRRLHFPHYVHYSTRSQVLHVYRQFHRYRYRFFDQDLCGPYLGQLIYESFYAYKYVTSEQKIKALLDRAQAELNVLQDAATSSRYSNVKNHRKQVRVVLDRVCSNYKLKEFPLRTLIKANRLKHDLLYSIRNLETPEARRLEDYQNAVKANEGLYYQYVKLLKQNKITTGLNGRKIQYDIPIEGTILGTPLPANRVKNLIRSTYSTTLRYIHYPVHPDIIDHIEKKLQDKTIPRLYRNVLKECLRDYFTVKHSNGRLLLQFSGNRLQLSKCGLDHL